MMFTNRRSPGRLFLDGKAIKRLPHSARSRRRAECVALLTHCLHSRPAPPAFRSLVPPASLLQSAGASLPTRATRPGAALDRGVLGQQFVVQVHRDLSGSRLTNAVLEAPLALR